MVLVCLPSDTLLQHLPSYLGFSYLGRGGLLQQSVAAALYLGQGRPSTLNVERGAAPLSPPAPAQLLLLGRGVAPLHHHP